MAHLLEAKLRVQPEARLVVRIDDRKDGVQALLAESMLALKGDSRTILCTPRSAFR